jgi:hypothetical protein
MHKSDNEPGVPAQRHCEIELNSADNGSTVVRLTMRRQPHPTKVGGLWIRGRRLSADAATLFSWIPGISNHASPLLSTRCVTWPGEYK